VSYDVLTAVVGALTTALALAFGVPQFLRVRRTGSVAGVSLPSITNTLVSTSAWLVYGLHLRDVWVTAMSVAGIPALLATFVVMLRAGGDRAGMWLPVSWAAMLATTAVLTPWAPGAFPTVLGCSVLWYVTPAAVTAWRSPDVSGLASGTWWLLVVEGLLAGAYGVLADVPASVVYAVVAGLGAVVVLTRIWWPWTSPCGRCAPVERCVCAHLT
jgi:uncharacterized protein with PQ loop repeat